MITPVWNVRSGETSNVSVPGASPRAQTMAVVWVTSPDATPLVNSWARAAVDRARSANAAGMAAWQCGSWGSSFSSSGRSLSRVGLLPGKEGSRLVQTGPRANSSFFAQRDSLGWALPATVQPTPLQPTPHGRDSGGPDPDELLTHVDWLRRLAPLVRDDAAADDLVQDAMEVAVRADAPSATSARSWPRTLRRRLPLGADARHPPRPA